MNQEIQLVSRPEGMPTANNFKQVDTDIPSLKEQEILVKSIYISVDPYMRGRMVDRKSYIPPFALNEAITGGVVAQVIETKSDKFNKGDYILTSFGKWQQYQTVKEENAMKLPDLDVPKSYFLSALGMPGLTAYFGMLDIGEPKEGETVVVSGAAGAVGMVAGQLAKIKGAKVIGIAGSDEKTRFLEEELHFDKTINYKTTPNILNELKEACPNGVDVYYDNVGGEISDAVISLINHKARIPLCGAISSYNKLEDYGPRLQGMLITTSSLMKGFIVSDYADQFEEATKQLAMYMMTGKLKFKETVVEGFDKLPEAFIGLFKGENIGKMVVKVGEPE
ncbi:NADP-dependent oxidoreductase [Bacillus carboniphilus]|uniref:NADP-dependent oxidoreductase n=1 Tax=Bacillus carboniphilus TaxID=86663 RepID=A0ABY9K023_9BACI|nr:NADP-dependent oxidoreductase [Bacillus carboniphilus]WLR44378.1 NADP-dependent oxidoreductase [Bacillus carboniphilus]